MLYTSYAKILYCGKETVLAFPMVIKYSACWDILDQQRYKMEVVSLEMSNQFCIIILCKGNGLNGSKLDPSHTSVQSQSLPEFSLTPGPIFIVHGGHSNDAWCLWMTQYDAYDAYKCNTPMRMCFSPHLEGQHQTGVRERERLGIAETCRQS